MAKQSAAQTRAARAKQSKTAKGKECGKAADKIGPAPGADKARRGEFTDKDGAVRELRRFPMSPAAQALWNSATSARRDAAAAMKAADELFESLIGQAAALDSLPPLGQGPGQLHGIGREGDEWVEQTNQPRR